MRHPRTTILGILTIVAVIVPAIQQLLSGGHPDWNLVAVGISAGIAQILGADAKAVAIDHATNAVNIAAVAAQTGTELKTKEQVAEAKK